MISFSEALLPGRNGLGSKEGRGQFHGIKQGCPGSKPTDVFGVNPETGDVLIGKAKSLEILRMPNESG